MGVRLAEMRRSRSEKSTNHYSVRWAALFLFLLSSNLFAASSACVSAASETSPPTCEEPVEDIDLMEMHVDTVVTGLRQNQEVKDMPYAVSVITAEDIRRSGARSIPDALRLVPGVDVAELGYGYYATGPRGFYESYGSQNLVLVDGRQIYDAYFGGTNWGSWPFMLEDIERIEVIRGPAGVTWGANATNGLINIVTKNPRDQQGTTFLARGGNRSTNKEYLGYAFTDGKLRMRVSSEYEGSCGFEEGGFILRPLDDKYRGGRFSLYGIYDKSPRDTITFSGGSAVVDGIFNPGLALGFNTCNSGSRANYIMTRWDHKIADDNSFQVTGYVNDFSKDIGTRSMELQYQQLALQISHSFKPAQTHKFTWGIDGRADLMDSSNADPLPTERPFFSTGVIGAYAQDEWNFAPKWSLGIGGRIDYEFYGGFQPSTRLSLSYAPDTKSLIYAAVSRAFQMPTIPYRYADVQILDGLIKNGGDHDMGATSVIAYEVGYRRTFFDRLEASANVYWNEYRDAVGFCPKLSLPELFLINMQDIGDFSTYGFEMETRYRVTKKLQLLANYTLQFMDWRGDVDFNFGVDSISPPKHKFMIGPRYDLTDNLHLSSQLHFVDAVTAPNPNNPFCPNHFDPYFRLDMRVEYEFWKKQAALAFGVSNLLNTNHYEGTSTFLNNAEVPRLFYGELRVTFK